MNVFDLMAKIGLDTSEYDRGLDQSEGKFSGFGDKIKAGFEKIKDNATSAVSAIASGVKSVVSTVGDMASSIYNATADLANYGDSIDKASQKIGISAKAYQEWEAVMQHSGTSMDSMTTSFKTLATASQGASADQVEAFKKLGLSMEEVSSMSTEELFSRTIAGLQGMEEGTERTTIASQLLGKGAMEMGALLNTSAEDTQAMIDRVNELGGVMSDEAVKESANFNDQLQDMNTAMDGLKRQMVAEFLPGLSSLMQGFTSLITGSDKAQTQLVAGFAKISEGIKNVVNKVSDIAKTLIPTMAKSIVSMLPTLANVAVDLLKTLTKTISENLPELITTAILVVETLADGIIEVLPELTEAAIMLITTLIDKLTQPDELGRLIDVAISIIMTLSTALIDALPVLIEQAPVIIDRLVKAVVDNLPKIGQLAVDLVMKLVTTISDNLGKLKESGGKILQSLIDGIKTLFTPLANIMSEAMGKVKDSVSEKVTAAKNWGKDLIDNFINGIKEKWENLKSTVSDVAQSVKDFLGFSEPKKGPLSNFHTYAPDMMDLFAKGIKDNTSKITGQLEMSLTDVKGAFEPDQLVINEVREKNEPPQNNDNRNKNSVTNIFNFHIAAGTISNDYDAYRAAQLMSEQLANLQAAQSISLGGIA